MLLSGEERIIKMLCARVEYKKLFISNSKIIVIYVVRHLGIKLNIAPSPVARYYISFTMNDSDKPVSHLTRDRNSNILTF